MAGFEAKQALRKVHLRAASAKFKQTVLNSKN